MDEMRVGYFRGSKNYLSLSYGYKPSTIYVCLDGDKMEISSNFPEGESSVVGNSNVHPEKLWGHLLRIGKIPEVFFRELLKKLHAEGVGVHIFRA